MCNPPNCALKDAEAYYPNKSDSLEHLHSGVPAKLFLRLIIQEQPLRSLDIIAVTPERPRLRG